MADPANIDALLESYITRAARAHESSMIRQLLFALDADEQDYPLDYPGLLRRLQRVIAIKLEQLGE